VICAGSANDVLRGGEGDDRLTGGLGNDRLTGGAVLRARSPSGDPTGRAVGVARARAVWAIRSPDCSPNASAFGS